MTDATPEEKQLRMFKPSKKEEAALKKEVRSRFDGRWAIIILFGLTLIASLFFLALTRPALSERSPPLAAPSVGQAVVAVFPVVFSLSAFLP